MGVDGADDVGRIIPAYAGSTGVRGLAVLTTRDHPRIRGEHWVGVGGAAEGGGSSPHTRGALGAAVGAVFVEGIIPAYAGSTPIGRFWRRRDRDHPRIRGEHILVHIPSATPLGSSPHTRGALDLTDIVMVSTGIIPAYAGSTVFAYPTSIQDGDHPRIRGEHCLS